MYETGERDDLSIARQAYFYNKNIVTKSQWPYPHIEAVINRYKVDDLGYQIEIKLWEEYGQWDSLFEAFVEKDAINNKDKFLDLDYDVEEIYPNGMHMFSLNDEEISFDQVPY